MAPKVFKGKLRSLYYEMTVEALINMGDKNSRDAAMLRIGGIVTRSNFIETDKRYCFPLVREPWERRINIDDKIKITIFCREAEVQEDDEKLVVNEAGAKYELWDDVSDSWTCLFERFEKDA